MKEFLKKNWNHIMLLFFIVQPIIDVLTSIFLNVFHIQVTFGLIIRMLFLILICCYNAFVIKGKYAPKYTIILGIYILLFMVNTCFTKGIDASFYELKNIMRYAYFPLLLMNMYEIQKQNPIEISPSTLQKIYMTYILLIIIPMLTNTDFSGYFEGKVGTIGWFNSTNEIGAILSGLLPLIFISNQKKWKTIIIVFLTIVVFFSLGSKITILSLVITGLFFLVRLFKNTQNKKKILALTAPILVIGCTITALLLPKTNFYKNIEIHLEFLEVDSIKDVLKDKKLIDHFIFSSRLTFLKNTRTSYLTSPLSSKLLGIGFIENYGTDKINLKTIEMDIFDIFYRMGIIGFLLFLYPIYIVLSEKSRKGYQKGNIALLIFTFISFFAGHVLTSPAVSIYITMLLVNIIKEEEVCKQEL